MKSTATRHYLDLWGLLESHAGVLFKRYYKKDETDVYLQPIVPKRKDVMYQMHSEMMAGHLGVKKTYNKARQFFTGQK